jgi:LysM repeat protein
MKNQSGCVKLGVIPIFLLGALGLVAICAFILNDYSSRQQDDARARYAPPVVTITLPEDGFVTMVGSYLLAAGTVHFSSQTPVTTLEWWLDGTRLESQSIASAVSPFYATYDLLVPTEGKHLLVLRAINSLGVIGNSPPITFETTAKGDAYYPITLAEGETLEELAANYGTDAATLQNLNPGLGAAPTAGTTIKVPVPPENEPAAPAQAPTGGSGTTLVPTAPMLQVGGASPLPGSLFLSAPPKAPTDLQGEVNNCKVKLIWKDNATNESGYEVWMAAGGSALTKLANLQPASGGAAWFEFQAPGPGYMVFWVEAVNSIGQQGSNIIYLNVDAGCPAGAPTHLQAEILDITVNTAAERVYCYVSFENAPEVRLPEGDGNFITVQNGHGNLAPWPHVFAVPFPQDGMLDISGECLGWAGNNLSKLGKFAVSAGSGTWNGSPILAHGAAFDVSLSLTAVSPTAPGVKYTSGPASPTDPSLPAPYALREERIYGAEFLPDREGTLPSQEEKSRCNPDLPCMRLSWRWDGDPKKIGGFKVFLNGDSASGYVNQADLLDTKTIVYLPGYCGRHVKWQVAAFSGTALSPKAYSPLSKPVEYDMPDCQAYLWVDFGSLNLINADDFEPDPCDTLETYFTLSVREETRSFWGGNFFLPMGCGHHYFSSIHGPYEQLYGPQPYVFTIPLTPGEDINDIWIRAKFWDYDEISDDLFASFSDHVRGAFSQGSQKWQSGERWSTCDWTEVTINSITKDAKSNLTFSYIIYPNACLDRPP